MRKLFFFSIIFFLSGCIYHPSTPNNIVDLTDSQTIETPDGHICKSEEMLIYPDRIEYYYRECEIRRIVKIKPRILPQVQIRTN